MKRAVLVMLLVSSFSCAGMMESLKSIMHSNAQTAAPEKQSVQIRNPQDTMSVTGSVKMKGDPVPGLTVYLVSKRHGRSYPVYTDDQGKFAFGSVAPSEDEHDSYFIQVYWGKRLVYQGKILVLDISPAVNIVLE